MKTSYMLDKVRYTRGGMPLFQKFYRKYNDSSNGMVKLYYKILFTLMKKINHIEISLNTKIGSGLYIGHPYCITINPEVVMGANINIHKGVTIGKENRGARKGAPILGDEVWIGVNSTIVGNITIGNDVLIAPNTFVNCDVPSHSIVFGNPCIIKHVEFPTENYINNRLEK